MENLSDFLAPDDVLLHLKARNMAEALREISARAAELTGLRALQIYEALSERARDGVGLGVGSAIPHARLPGLKRVIAFFARPLEPIVIEEGEPIRLLFVLLAPEGAHAMHLRALAKIAGLLRDPAARLLLETTADKDVAYATLIGA